MEALISRTIYFDFKPTYKEKLHLIRQLVTKPYKELKNEEKQEIYEFIEKNSSPATENLNLMTFQKLCDFFRYDKKNWQKLAIAELKTDERLAIIYDLMNSDLPVEEQAREYSKRTKECRKTYFNLKQKLV